jgi:hypothetical protein
MREVSRSRCVGSLFVAVAICSLVGCVMPSRESLKEPTWGPGSGRGPTTGGGLPRTSLIKPFIPPDKPESVQQGPLQTSSGMRGQSPVAMSQEPMQQRGSNEDATANTSPQPVPPQPIRWHAPPQDQTSYVRPAIEPSSQQFPSDRDLANQGMEQHTEAPSLPVAAVEASPISHSPLPVEPSPSMQGPPPPLQPAPPVQAPSAAQTSHAISPTPRSQPYAQLPSDRRHASERDARPAELTATPAAPAPPQTPAALEAKAGSRQWEDQKVRQAAIKLSHQFQGVKKGKICYSVKNDEWWVVLYEDAGPMYELKQYTWNRDQEKLEEFLVLKKIGKNRLEEDRSARDPDRACEAVDFP